MTFQGNRKIRVGLVGCGRISENHLRAIAQLSKDLEVIALCDTDKNAFKKIKPNAGLALHSDLNSMLAAEKLDVVSLCTPSGLHPEQTIAAAQKGVHVLTEKPMATRYLDGVRMVNACDKAGVKLFVVKQNRLNPTLKLLKKAVTEDRFGTIKMVQANVFWTRPQSYYDAGEGWRGTWEFDGGAFMNQASHYVDLIDWLIGPIEKVQAMTSTTRNIEVEDTGVLNMRWRNGALGSMAVTMLTYPKNLEGSITILGEKGTVKIGGVAVNKIDHWEFEDSQPYDQEIKNVNYDTESVYGFGHFLVYENLVNVLRLDTRPDTDGREGLKSLELLTAAYIAARDDKSVGLPLDLMGFN